MADMSSVYYHGASTEGSATGPLSTPFAEGFAAGVRRAVGRWQEGVGHGVPQRGVDAVEHALPQVPGPALYLQVVTALRLDLALHVAGMLQPHAAPYKFGSVCSTRLTKRWPSARTCRCCPAMQRAQDRGDAPPGTWRALRGARAWSAASPRRRRPAPRARTSATRWSPRCCTRCRPVHAILGC